VTTSQDALVTEACYLPIDGAASYVEQVGTGTPVLCLHTAGQSGVQWRYTTVSLAALGYRVVVPDLPGHGRSEPAQRGPVSDLGAYASWSQQLIEKLGLRRPFIVGCSIGGKIALDLAARMGGEIAGAVVMAAGSGSGRANAAALRRELEDIAAPSRADRAYLGTLAVIGGSVSRERAELIAAMHRREDPVITTHDLLGWATHDIRDRLRSIACPVHLVVGDEDLWLDPGQVRETAAAIPIARFTVLPGIGHYPMEEIDGFADVLHGWLADLEQPNASAEVAR